MPKILYMKGLPASGKSTVAKGLVKQGWVRVNKDDIRAMCHSSVWSRDNEELVVRIEDGIIEEALRYGQNVVVDDTGFAAKNERRVRKIAAKYNADFDVQFIDTDLKTCLARNAMREGVARVPDEAIKTMYGKYIGHGKFVLEYPLTLEEYAESKVAYDPALPWCIMSDLDGTLADMCARSPYEWHKVGGDFIVDAVAEVIRTFRAKDLTISQEWGSADLDYDEAHGTPYTRIIIMSGRDEVCRGETAQWLNDNEVPFDELFMRPEGDMRKDSIVKMELFDAHIRDKYNVLFVMDDRPQVVRLWKSLGLYVFDCNQPGFEF